MIVAQEWNLCHDFFMDFRLERLGRREDHGESGGAERASRLEGADPSPALALEQGPPPPPGRPSLSQTEQDGRSGGRADTRIDGWDHAQRGGGRGHGYGYDRAANQADARADYRAFSSRRFFMTPSQAICIILILVTGLAASLTLLIIQSSSIHSLQMAVGIAASQKGVGRAGEEGNRTVPESSSSSPSSGRAARPSPARGSAQPERMPTQNGPPAKTESKAGAPAPAQAPVPAPAKININTATSEQLQTIKGIGPSTAKKIIDYRTAKGPFHSVDDLLNVSGIGVKTLAKIRAYITV